MNFVKIHKDFNRSAIPFYREKALDFFTEIARKWNSMQEYEPIVYDLSDFRKALDLEGTRNEEYFQGFVLQFVKDTTISYQIADKTITGNVFSVVQHHKENTFTIKINEDLREFLFTQKDVELMQKVKTKKTLTVTELDDYKKNQEKYSNLMIYSQSELLNLDGKYNKRLYMLLIQFKKSSFFIMNYKEFKGILEIPDTYEQCNIDNRILKPAKQELLKAGIEILSIKKLKDGGKSIQRIEIHFNYKNLFAELKETFKEPEKHVAAAGINMSEEVINTGLEQIEKLKKMLDGSKLKTIK